MNPYDRDPDPADWKADVLFAAGLVMIVIGFLIIAVK